MIATVSYLFNWFLLNQSLEVFPSQREGGAVPPFRRIASAPLPSVASERTRGSDAGMFESFRELTSTVISKAKATRSLSRGQDFLGGGFV